MPENKEIIIKGVTYIEVETKTPFNCDVCCAKHDLDFCMELPFCTAHDRPDKKNVYFTKKNKENKEIIIKGIAYLEVEVEAKNVLNCSLCCTSFMTNLCLALPDCTAFHRKDKKNVYFIVKRKINANSNTYKSRKRKR